ncbi:MAG: substrate-binding domain-containing protein [Chloroflexota bacterium]|nr:substrate-binding domain-containing protein [Chloroflexota bacterium]
MLPGQRQVVILNLLQQQSMVTVAEICARCNCSAETARRDLRRLEEKGLLDRTYGGALRVSSRHDTSLRSVNLGLIEARTALVDRADVLIVTPAETATTRLLVDRALRMSVPVVAESHNYHGATTVITIDDYSAGVELGHWVANYARANLNGNVRVLDVSAPFANTRARSRGFADSLRHLPAGDHIIHRVNGEGLRDTSFRIAQDAFSVHPDINVIFGINDDTALGALEAYRSAGLDESRVIVVSIGFEGSTVKDLMVSGGPYKAGIAMFPELVGRFCVDTSICAYQGNILPDRVYTPHVLITDENLDQYYTRSAEENGTWHINMARSDQMLSASPSLSTISRCALTTMPARIGYVQIFSSHAWYRHIEHAMLSRARELGITLEVVDASQDMASEVDDLKKAIGFTAARFVNTGDRIILDAGTTTAYLALALRGRQQIQVMTNSLPVLTELDGESGIELFVAGGMYRHESHSMVGPGTQSVLAELRVDKAFISGAGVSLDFGVSNSNITEAAVKQAMIKAARQVIMLADHTKIGVESLVNIAPLSSIHTLVTDAAISAHDRKTFTQGGVDVVIAEI